MSKYPEKVLKGLRAPWGYKKDPDDPKRLLPIDDMLDAYEEAKQAQKDGCSWKEVAKWLSMETGVHISASGLFQKVKQEIKERNRARGKLAWENRFEKQHTSTETETEETSG